MTPVRATPRPAGGVGLVAHDGGVPQANPRHVAHGVVGPLGIVPMLRAKSARLVMAPACQPGATGGGKGACADTDGRMLA